MTFSIRRTLWAGFGLLIVVLLLSSACMSSGVSEEVHSKLQADFEELQTEFDALEDENKELKKELKAAEPAGHGEEPASPPASQTGEQLGRPNVLTSFNPDIEWPKIDATAYIDPEATVIGHVTVSAGVYFAPNSVARGDEGQPIFIGEGSNLQDGVVLHALETFDGNDVVAANLMTVHGQQYANYIGNNVSLAHQSHVHGPAVIGDNTFIGMQALVFRAVVGSGVVVEPGALIMGVTIPDGHYVPAGSVITNQEDADALPHITDAYPLKDINAAVLHVNQQLADGYNGTTSGGHESGSAESGGAESGGH